MGAKACLGLMEIGPLLGGDGPFFSPPDRRRHEGPGQGERVGRVKRVGWGVKWGREIATREFLVRAGDGVAERAESCLFWVLSCLVPTMASRT